MTTATTMSPRLKLYFEKGIKSPEVAARMWATDEIKKLISADDRVPKVLQTLLSQHKIMVRLVEARRTHPKRSIKHARYNRQIKVLKGEILKSENEYNDQQEEIADDVHRLTGRDLAAGEGISTPPLQTQLAARSMRALSDPSFPLIVGVDVASDEGDRTVYTPIPAE